MKNMFLVNFFVAMLWGLCLKATGQNNCPADTFPIPGTGPNQLFYLQRQPNANTIIVDLNINKGKVDIDNPVHVYWIKYENDGQKSELNWLQRTFAFGIQSKKISERAYELNFVSYKKMKFNLELGADKLWRVYAKTNTGSRIILRRLYLHVNGGTFWKPNIEYVELKGDEPSTNREVRDRFKID